MKGAKNDFVTELDIISLLCLAMFGMILSLYKTDSPRFSVELKQHAIMLF